MEEYARWESSGLDDAEFIALLTRLSAQIARFEGFPCPAEYSRWSDRAVKDLALDVFNAKKGRTLALKILEKADSQGVLERLLLATIKNYLIDGAKATPAGKLRRRLINVFKGDARLEHLTKPEPAWALAAGPRQLWQGDRARLVEAAMAVTGYQILKLNAGGPTPAPAKTALREVSHGVLVEAAAAVRDQELAVVLLERFPFLALVERALDASEAETSFATSTEHGSEYQAVLQIVVDDLWTSLDEVEQLVLCHLGEVPGEWSELLGLRPARAQLLTERVAEKLRLALTEDDFLDETLKELRRRSVLAGEHHPELRRLSVPDTEAEPRGGADA